MIEIINKENCCGCSACVQVCPKQCIIMKEDNEGFLYPKVDKSLCVNCHLCEKVCPMLKKTIFHEPLCTFAYRNDNKEIRYNSTSGGFFFMLAENIIKRGGVVFGAVFDSDWSVKHIHISDIKHIKDMSGSKYLQSRQNNTFIEVKDFLDKGKYVLYTGTSCQIQGLVCFLKKKYDKLITVDCLCHGVPSPKVWSEYLKEISKGRKPISVKFRDKNSGWKNYTFSVIYDDGSNYIQKAYDNLYMRGFLNDIYLRPSCYNCNFKVEKSLSDITMADFWGVDEICSKCDDDLGTSLVIIHTPKIYDLIKLENYIEEFVPLSKVKIYNSGFKSSIIIPRYKRKYFFSKFRRENICIESLIEKTLKGSIIDRIKRKIKLIVNFR